MNRLLKIDQPHGLGFVKIRWQRGSGGYLATSGNDHTVAIFNRNGKHIERLSLPGMCTDFGWDRDGDILAIISANSSTLFLWDSNTHRKHQLDCGLRDPLSCVLWAKNGYTLAVTTTKGNMCIYNHSTSRRIPIIGKHSKAITCGMWNSENLLALGSEDRSISISNIEGDTLRVIPLRAEPSLVAFSEMKIDERSPGENTVSVIVGRQTLFLYNLQDPENQHELGFQNRYGKIVSYQWFGDGYILIGFSEGYLVSISTHANEIGQELHQSRTHNEKISDIALNSSTGRIALCGDQIIKVHDVVSLPETAAIVNIDDGCAETLAWSEDGQLLAATTTYGSVMIFLSKLPILASAYLNHVCVLTSLSQITLYILEKNKSIDETTIETDIEPTFLCIGPYHIVVGMNNRVWFYALDIRNDELILPLKRPRFLFDREYLGNINNVCLNSDFISVFFEGKIHLHQIDPTMNNENEDVEIKIFPTDGNQYKITCHWLTPEFLVYGTDLGHLRYFYLEDWKIAIEHQHKDAIKSIHLNSDGLECIFIDIKNDGYIYSPVTESVMAIPRFFSGSECALWDTSITEKHVFVTYDTKTIYTYVHVRDSLNGAQIHFIGESKRLSAHIPLFLNQGELICETSNGKISHVMLNTHQVSASVVKKDQKAILEQNLSKYLELLRYQEAWNLCCVIDSKNSWSKLANTALMNLNIDTAINVYSYVGDVGMVVSLKSLEHIENKKLIAGHICKFLGEFDKAQELFLESDQPLEALCMRTDILQWDLALQLAENLAPERIPFICREYAQQLELMGRYTEALNYYEKGLKNDENVDDKHIISCHAGIARMSIRTGDYQKGIKIATGPTTTKSLLHECAELFENLKKFGEAAQLYVVSENYNKAASCYIRMKNWTEVGNMLQQITSNKIHSQFAKAMEAMGNYRKAAAVYELARDYDNMIRITLDKLNDADDALRIVQETRSIEGAKMVAKHFRKVGDFISAVKFLIMSGCYEEAFKLATEHDHLELYGNLLIDEMTNGDIQNELVTLATIFEKKKNPFLAGKYYFHGKQYRKALKHLLAAAKNNPENEEVLSLAIDVVAASQDELLATQVIELLLGDVDGEARDPKFMFRLYMAKKSYSEAAKTAIIIAHDEQVNGNYRQAHEVLFTMCCDLKVNELKIATEMVSSLMLLHSYILVRLHVKLGNHLKAALLLMRVADNISKFPAHAVPILTSAVIECHRANLKLSAFKFASTLMKPEYRHQIDDKYKKKIEGVIRKAPKGTDLSDEVRLDVTPCPYCDKPLTCTQLKCGECHNNLPFCIATGWHISKNNTTACPSCSFPALYSEFIELLNSFNRCPMCNEVISKANVSLLPNANLNFY